MEDLIKKLVILIQRKRNFIIYVMIGLFGLVIDFGVFIICTRIFNLDLTVSNVISNVLAIINNFILNSLFNFKTRDKIYKRFISFFSIALIGIVISSALLNFLHYTVGLDSLIAKFISLILVVLLQYNLNKRFSFK